MNLFPLIAETVERSPSILDRAAETLNRWEAAGMAPASRLSQWRVLNDARSDTFASAGASQRPCGRTVDGTFGRRAASSMESAMPDRTSGLARGNRRRCAGIGRNCRARLAGLAPSGGFRAVERNRDGFNAGREHLLPGLADGAVRAP